MSATSWEVEEVGGKVATASTEAVAPVAPPIASLLSEEEWVQSLSYVYFSLLTPSQAPYLTTAQIATIPSASYLSSIPTATRAALSTTQLRALNIDAVGVSQLTLQQISVLTTAQIQQVKYWEFDLLPVSSIPQLSLAQVASLPSISSVADMSPAARGAFTTAQLRSLNIDGVGLTQLTAAQISLLTPAQIRQAKWWEFRLLPVGQIPNLSSSQLASIPSIGGFAEMSSAARGALTTTQVQSLDVAAVGITQLTPAQIGVLTPSQVQQINHWELGLLVPSQAPNLHPVQLASISSATGFAAMSAEARAALTLNQVRSLNISAVGIAYLTPTQLTYLTAPQLQQIKYWEFEYLAASQIPWLTPEQLSSITSISYLADMSPEARAAFNAAQVRGLNIAAVGVSLLTPAQIDALLPAQIQQVRHWELNYITPAQAPNLSVFQMASIPSLSFFASMPAASRAALTATQVRALNVYAVGIGQLNSTQIAVLTTSQVQAVKYWEFELLNVSQIPLLTSAQMRSIKSGGTLLRLPDPLRRAFTRAQLLSLTPEQLIGFVGTETEQTPPTNYVSVVDRRTGAGGSHAHESMKFYNLAPLAEATHVAVTSGAWSDPRTWLNGKIPSAGAKVVVPAGTTVLFDAYMNSAVKTVRIDGTLTFASNRNTQLKVDTVVVTSTGKLYVGTEANPISDNVTARILIADGGPINRTWDPYGLSRGVLSGGEVRMFGKAVTPYVTLAVDPVAGDTVLQLSSIPENWKVGDQLVVSGTNAYTSDFGADRVTIRAINGNRITVDRLTYSHDAPDGLGLSIYVANLTRNVVFEAEDASVVAERPHMVFFESPNVQIENIAVNGFGRTDKSVPINDPVVIGGVLQPGTGTNPRARYALHFHHTGVDPLVTPAQVSGSVVNDSPGWGFVNHQSNVIFEQNVAFNVKGASFVAEDGNEIGQFVRNLSLNSTGATYASMHSRRANHDFGFNGHGFWMQGPGVELIGNIAAGSGFSGFTYYTASSKAQFDAVNLKDQSLAGGNKIVPVNALPLAMFRDNVSFATQAGLELWFNQQNMTDSVTKIDRFTSWNTIHSGIGLHYSGRIEINQAKLVGNLQTFVGAGIATNAFTSDVTVNGLQAYGFAVGIDVPLRGATVINGANISAVQGVFIEKGHDTLRSVLMVGQIGFNVLSPSQLQGRTPWRVYMTEVFDYSELRSRRFESFLSQDSIVWAPTGSTPKRLAFVEQLRGFVPFQADAARGSAPNEYLGKTNYQLYSQYGVALGGVYLSGAEESISGIRGYALNL